MPVLPHRLLPAQYVLSGHVVAVQNQMPVEAALMGETCIMMGRRHSTLRAAPMGSRKPSVGSSSPKLPSPACGLHTLPFDESCGQHVAASASWDLGTAASRDPLKALWP